MRNTRLRPWIHALIAWAGATVLIGGGYLIWATAMGQPILWETLRDAAMITIPLALVLAWRDRNRR